MIRLGRIQRRVVRELVDAGGALDMLFLYGPLAHFPRAPGALLRALWRLEHRGLLIRCAYRHYSVDQLSPTERARLKIAREHNPRARVIWVLSDHLAAERQERSAKCSN